MLEKEVWDWQDAAVAADWAMERGVFGSDLWRCFPPDFVRCLAECPEILARVGVPPSFGRAWAGARAGSRAGAWAWAGAWVGAWAGAGAGAWAGALVGAWAGAWVGAWAGAGAGTRAWVGNSGA